MMLADLQRDFRAWLTGASSDAASRLGTDAGLAVYQNNYRAQLVGCLEQAYPQLRRRIGDQEFLRASIAHIDSHPPHAWTLDHYGDDFGTTLAELFPHNPDLHELAWIERALAIAFVAPDADPLPLDAWTAIDWDTASLRIAPSFALRAAVTNAEEVWSALWQELDAPDSEMLAEPGGLIAWRRGHVSRLRQVDALERDALLGLQVHGSFAALCQMLVERLGADAGVAKAGALLAAWLANDIVIDAGWRT